MSAHWAARPEAGMQMHGRLRMPAARDAVLLVALFVLALAVRAPYLLAAPGLTDEIEEMELALDAYRGEVVLVGVNPYIGALHSYLVALGWHLVGAAPELPRFLSLVVGAATVPAAYLLGREMHGRTAGLLTALLVGASGFHILVNSHIGWSNCLTPFFTTTACAALAAAVRRGSGVTLAVGGLLFGLAAQTHTLGLLLLPGVVGLVIWRRPRLVLSRWGGLAIALFLLATSTILIHNVATGLSTLSRSAERAQEKRGLELAAVPGNFVIQLRKFGLLLSGQVPFGGSTGWDVAALPLGLAILASVQQARRGNPLPLVAICSALLLLSLASERIRLPLQARYQMPILVVGYAALGAFLADQASRLRNRHGPRLSAAVAVAMTSLLVVPSTLALVTHYRALDGSGRAPVLYSAARLVDDLRAPGEPVLVDANIPKLDTFLRVLGVPFTTFDADLGWMLAEESDRREGLAALSCRSYGRAREMPPATSMRALGNPTDVCRGVAVVRLGPMTEDVALLVRRTCTAEHETQARAVAAPSRAPKPTCRI